MNNLHIVTNRSVIKIIIGIFVISFIFSNVSNYFIDINNNYVAKINGQAISHNQFENVFTKEHDFIKKQLGDQYIDSISSNDEYIKIMRRQVLNNLIDQILIDQYIKHLKLDVSDEQVKKAIFSTEAFQSSGQFDINLYKSIINRMGISIDHYVHAFRTQLKVRQLIDSIIGSDFILKDEIDKLLELITQQRVIREAKISVEKLVDKQQISDAEIYSFYEQNRDKFIIPEQFKVKYIKLDAENFQENVSESEIQFFYNQNQEKFVKQQQKRYSIIQLKTESDAKEILDNLNKGMDFAKIAKEKSIDVPSARKGGDIGWIEDSLALDELKNAALKEKGKISGIIKSSVGYLILRLDDIEQDKIKPLVEVYDEIAAKIKKKKTMDAYQKIQQKVIDAADKNNESLNFIEQIVGKAIETDWFSRNNLPKELNFKPVINVIFKGNLINKDGIPSSNSSIITIDDSHTLILRIVKYKSEIIRPLAEVKINIIEQLKYNKAIQQTKLDIAKLVSSIKNNEDNKQLEEAGIKFSAPKILTRAGKDSITKKVFSLAPPINGKSTYGIMDDIKGNIIFLALDEIKLEKISEPYKEKIIKSFIQSNEQIIFEALIDNLHKKSKIKINKYFK